MSKKQYREGDVAASIIGTAQMWEDSGNALRAVSVAKPLPVDQQAGEVHLGEVGGSSDIIEVTLSLDTGAYADGDVLAATQEIAGAMRINGGTGLLHSLVLLDKDDQGGALDIVLLKTNVSIGTENAAVSVSDDSADECLGVVEVAAANYVDLINSQIVTKSTVGIEVKAAAASTSLYVAAISRGTKTYTASGITLKFGFIRD